MDHVHETVDHRRGQPSEVIARRHRVASTSNRVDLPQPLRGDVIDSLGVKKNAS
jgi:hypothetical protein